MKYKPGDKVKIKTWKQMEEEFELDSSGDITINRNNDGGSLSFITNMERLINESNKNRVLTVKEIHKNSAFNTYSVVGYIHFFTDEMIECLVPEKIYEPIHSRFEILDIR